MYYRSDHKIEHIYYVDKRHEKSKQMTVKEDEVGADILWWIKVENTHEQTKRLRYSQP